MNETQDINTFLNDLHEGDEFYVTHSISQSDPDESECKYVLSHETAMSVELRLERLEKLVEPLGVVFCPGVLDYKVKRTTRMIDEV